MKSILVNYNFTPTWLLESDLDWHIYDRSESKEWLKDFPQERITYTENVGNVDFDKLCYLVDMYDDLPEVFLWGKTNLFPRFISEEEYNKVKDSKEFTPLLTQGHKTYSDNLGPVCHYSGGLYLERNNNWYASQFPSRYFETFGDFAQEFNIENPSYIPFAPGGNYLLTRERVHRYSRDYYEKMASLLPYATLPLEAQFCERAYYLMWK